MELDIALQLVKERIDLRSMTRDWYITTIIESVVTELKDEKGLVIDVANPHHLMFIVDFSAWRYQNRDSPNAMPRHLQYRLHNLMIGGVRDGI